MCVLHLGSEGKSYISQTGRSLNVDVTCHTSYHTNILSRATSLGAPLYGGVRTWVEGQRGREETRQWLSLQPARCAPIIPVHSHRNLPNPALISPRGPHRRSRQYCKPIIHLLCELRGFSPTSAIFRFPNLSSPAMERKKS